MTTPSRPTMYKGVRMRSRLEADYAASLDRGGLKWRYEPQCFAGSKGQWLPDFEADGTYVELKPSGLLESHYVGVDYQHGGHKTTTIDELLTRMTVTWESEPGAALRLIYWEYGVGNLATIMCFGQGNAWEVQHRDMVFPMLWTGMGQYQLCRHG